MATPAYHMESTHVVRNPYYHPPVSEQICDQAQGVVADPIPKPALPSPVLNPYWEQTNLVRQSVDVFEQEPQVDDRMTPWTIAQQQQHQQQLIARHQHLQHTHTTCYFRPGTQQNYYSQLPTIAEPSAHRRNVYFDQAAISNTHRQDFQSILQQHSTVICRQVETPQLPMVASNEQHVYERHPQQIMMEQHMKQQHFNQPVVRKFRSRAQVNQLEKEFQCPLCHKQYCRKSTLKAHLRQHSGERPYLCQICGKTFSQAANLTAHKRVHTGEKPFSCAICLRPFSQSSSLVTHRRTHTGERPYQCAHCDKAFTDSSTLTKHMRTHTGHKPYECQVCCMRFTQSGNLHRHMKTHRE